MGEPVSTSIMVTMLAASTAYAGYQKRNAGIAAKYEYQARARQEEMSARDREIERRNRLLKSLSSRSAMFASQGTTMEGSPSAILLNDFSQYELERTTAAANLAATTSQLRAAGRNAKLAGNQAFYGSLFQAGATLAGGDWSGLKLNQPASQATSAVYGSAPQAGVRLA